MFLQVRAEASRRFEDIVRELAPELDEEQAELIAAAKRKGLKIEMPDLKEYEDKL